MAKDVVIPIVFPDYLIAVKIPEVKVEAPDYLPWFDILPESVAIPKTKNKKQKTKYRTWGLQNRNPNRVPHDLFSNSCIHFAKGVTEAARVDTPWMLDPRPNSYIGEFRDDFPDPTDDPKNRSLDIEGIGQF